MSLLLFLLYALKSYVDARPIPGFSSHSNPLGISVRDLTPLTSECTCPETRSIWDIVWGCFVTIIACTWVSIHPNIPDKDERSTGSIFRRVKLMIYAFLVPEVVIIWAIRQRIAASRLVSTLSKRYEDKIPKDRNEWTIRHGFFLQMGGFMLYENGEPKYTILPKKFRTLLDENRIDFPRVHEKDIADRSKGDFFSKGVVLMQTTWFVVQCIARWARGLGLTELEVLTLALAVLNGVIYFLWLHKPLNVQWHVRVDLKAQEKNSHGIIYQEVDSDSMPTLAESLPADSSNKPLLNHPPTGFGNTNGHPGYFIWLRITLRSALSTVSGCNFVHNYRRRVERHGFFLSVVRYLTMYPFLTVFKPIYDMTVNDKIESEPKCAPMFYADDDNNDVVALIGGIFIGSIFGAIHCIAWSFQFPSHREQTLWRISAIAVTAAPLAIGGAGLFAWLVENVPGISNVIDKSLRILAVSIAILSLFLYIIARMTLLVLALLSLCVIPPNSLSQIDWVSFVPHI